MARALALTASIATFAVAVAAIFRCALACEFAPLALDLRARARSRWRVNVIEGDGGAADGLLYDAY